MASFFAELKRRNVYKVAVAYAVVAWLLIQAASILFPTFEAPSWVMKVFVTIVAAGFPIALVLAWAFELTPEGIKRSDEVPPSESIAHRTGRKLLAIVAVLALIAVGLLAFQLTRRNSPVSAQRISAIPLKSIAVLPFANLSEDKANAYFADGIQDEILTRLSRITELKVISRTSTQQYQSKPGNVPEIAKQLGVAHILEGSVQRLGDQVRVNVQLIKAEGDSHLWADTYDRKLTDVFAVESEVAQRIADSLEARLTGHEQEQVSNVPTQNPQAYDEYLRGRVILNKQGYHEVENAVAHLRKAVELDPQYAQAWAQLATAESLRYLQERTAAQLERARAAGETAVRLQPELAEAHLGMSAVYYYCLRDYDRALAELEQARSRAPNDPLATFYIGLVKRRQGKLEESIEFQKKATVFDPRNSDIWVNLGRSYRGTRDFKSAREMLDRAIAIAPDEIDIVGMKAETYQAEGNLDAMEELLRGRKVDVLGDAFFAQLDLLIARRRFDEAFALLSDLLARTPANTNPVVSAQVKGFLGELYDVTGRPGEARPLLEDARQEFLAQRAQGNESLDIADGLLLIDATLRDRPEFEREGALMLERTKGDEWRHPKTEELIAQGYAILGDADRVIPVISRLLATNYVFAITRANLRMQPAWDNIRNDPRFQKLCEQP